MRYATICLITLLSSCSWSWPWGANKTGNCLDDGTCDGANPFEEELRGGTWYCYGVSKKEPWNCNRESDETKIKVIEEKAFMPSNAEDTSLKESPFRSTIKAKASLKVSEPKNSSSNLFPNFSNGSFAVQLIALKTLEEVKKYAIGLGIKEPILVKVRSKNSDLHVLLAGIYEDRVVAETAAKTWETEHALSSKPWIRPISELRKAADLSAP